MVGAGDLIHNDILNVEMFDSDVFFCNAWNINGSFQANVDYLESTQSSRIICVVDYYNEVQRRRFIDAFKGRFHHIDGHGGHVPHFTVAELEELLVEGGEAVNIHEKSETMLPFKDAKYFLEHGYFPGYKAASSYLTGRIYMPSRALTSEEIAEITELFIKNIRTAKVGRSNQITLDIENLEDMSLSELQEIATCLQYEKEMPLNMKGRICMNMRSWRSLVSLEIVMRKVSVDFFESIIDATIPDKKAYADRVIEGIRNDMRRGDIFGQFAKYRTLNKLLKI